MGSGGEVSTSIPLEALKAGAELASKLLDLLPLNVAASLLTEESRKRANAVADAAEVAKFGVPHD